MQITEFLYLAKQTDNLAAMFPLSSKTTPQIEEKDRM